MTGGHSLLKEVHSIVSFFDVLKAVDTTGVEPLHTLHQGNAHPTLN